MTRDQKRFLIEIGGWLIVVLMVFLFLIFGLSWDEEAPVTLEKKFKAQARLSQEEIDREFARLLEIEREIEYQAQLREAFGEKYLTSGNEELVTVTRTPYFGVSENE